MLKLINEYLREVKYSWQAENRPPERTAHEEQTAYRKAKAKADKRFNIVQRGNAKFIVLDGIKVTDGTQDNAVLLELLMNLRKMYINDQMKV